MVGLSGTVFWPDGLDTNRSILRAVSLKFAYARDCLQYDDDEGEIHFISILKSIVSSSCQSGQFDNKNVRSLWVVTDYCGWLLKDPCLK